MNRLMIISFALAVGLIGGISAQHFSAVDDPWLKDPVWNFKPQQKVSNQNHDFLGDLHKSLEHRLEIEELISQVSETTLRQFAYDLTGQTSNISTRHSTSTVIQDAARFVQQTFVQQGFSNTVLDPFRIGWGPNVISELPGVVQPNRIVVVGAHMDCRNQNTQDNTGRAPGANDDASGTVAMMEIGRVLAATNARFAYTVRIGCWAGEEQGLVGSRDYAARMRQQNQDIAAMIQADMIGYHSPQFPLPTLHLVTRNTDRTLTELVRDVVGLYVPSNQLTVGNTTACCSDHQSFLEQGFASAGFVEGGGYSIDPQYHNVNDVVDRAGYDLTQIALHTKGILASLAVIAGLQ